MLKTAGPFTILTDHKNLEYFMTKRHLSERQIRWSETLSLFPFTLKYRPGVEAILPDALSRREQDTLGEDDKASRFMRLLSPNTVDGSEATILNPTITAADDTVAVPVPTTGPFQDEELNSRWEETVSGDTTYQTVLRAMQDGARSFPTELKLKIQVGDCSIDEKGRLRHRDKLWVPGAPATTEAEYKQMDSEEAQKDVLRTKLIQSVHDSPINGHPGRDSTSSILGRDFYWPLLSRHVRQFCRNCDSCSRNKVWRVHKHGLLRPLPVPERFFSEISMDFMTDLPDSWGCKNLWVIKDRLSRTVVLEGMSTMKAEDCARQFMDCWVRHHGIPTAITSDRGTNWTSTFWRTFCELVGVRQRLSSAYHPQTDGGPERMNQEVQAYLRAFINQQQSDWKRWLPVAQLALNGRYQAGLGMSPFFATHGYDVPAAVPLEADPERQTSASRTASRPANVRAVEFVRKIKQITDLCQATMAAAAQKQEENANRTRTPAPIYKEGDKAWLDLRNYTTDRPKKSLDVRHAKYTVDEALSPVAVRLRGIPSNIHPVFHTDLLKPAAGDPLPGQETDDAQPDPVLFETHEEWPVEEILCARNKKRGKGREVLVKWAGFHDPTWEPLDYVEDTEALDDFEAKHGSAKTNDGPLAAWEKKQKKKKAGPNGTAAVETSATSA